MASQGCDHVAVAGWQGSQCACICAIARNEHFFTSLSKHTARFYCPELPCPAEAVVKGDSHVAAISVASIIAKVARDREMIELDA